MWNGCMLRKTSTSTSYRTSTGWPRLEGRDYGEADPEGDVGEIDLDHIAAVPSGVVAACEKVRKVDT